MLLKVTFFFFRQFGIFYLSQIDAHVHGVNIGRQRCVQILIFISEIEEKVLTINLILSKEFASRKVL